MRDLKAHSETWPRLEPGTCPYMHERDGERERKRKRERCRARERGRERSKYGGHVSGERE